MNAETNQIFLINPPEHQQTCVLQKLEVPSVPPVNLENVCDFSLVCRVCASITECTIPVFAGEGLRNNLADKINKHLPIQVCVEDQLPLSVCYQCSGTLLAWHELTLCCQQADSALRTRLARLTQHQDVCVPEQLEPAPPAPEPEPPTQHVNPKEEQCGPPPAYPASPPRACAYCPLVLSPSHSYQEHLIDAHSDLLFHCDECDTYVARTDFILHMSVHAVVMATEENNDEEDQLKRDDGTMTVEEKPRIKQEAKETVEVKKQSVVEKQSEFTDHSDVDDFDPLPDSVFEAIEDSQDSQPDTSKSNNTSSTDPSPVKKKKHKKTRTCPICAKVYTASSSYFYHMKYFHNNSKDHECDKCGKKFGTKANLRNHLNLHSEEFQFQCKECDKKFRSKASLYIHEQSHNGVKSYACNQCQTKFRWRTHLKRHLKRHSADKCHVCSTCGRGFSIRCDLLRHAQTHTAGNHTCDKCGAKFAQLRYLKVHVDKKHSVNGGSTSAIVPDTSSH